jgi:hypothetical protein
MITSVDTEDWTENQNTQPFTQLARAFEYSIDGTYFQDSNFEYHQWRIHGACERQNGCATVTDEVYLLMYPKFFTPKRWI